MTSVLCISQLQPPPLTSLSKPPTPPHKSGASCTHSAAPTLPVTRLTPTALRYLCRTNTHTTTTSALTTTVQANLLILPSALSSSFQLLCQRNPVSCPLLSVTPRGVPRTHLAPDADLTTDLPRYNVYVDGNLVTHDGVTDIKDYWTEDSVGFLIGCSFSFETALINAGFPPPHTLSTPAKTVPMFRTSIPLAPAGEFTSGTVVVSMRCYPSEAIPRIREITRRFPKQHGEPIAWGWDGAERIGVAEKLRRQEVDFGDWVEIEEGTVPLFWGCGVTPQVAVMESEIGGCVVSHRPGCMFVTDVEAGDEGGLGVQEGWS